MLIAAFDDKDETTFDELLLFLKSKRKVPRETAKRKPLTGNTEALRRN